MSRTFSVSDHVEVELSMLGEVVEDVDVFFLRQTFFVVFGVVGGVGDGSSNFGLFDLPFFLCLFALPCLPFMNFFTR